MTNALHPYDWDPARAALPPLPAPPRVVHVAAPVRDAATAPNQMPAVLALPGSKYLTLRYLLNALLAAGESRVRGLALADDTAVLVAALRALGGRLTWEAAAETDVAGGEGERVWSLRVEGIGGRPVAPGEPLRMGNAGAVLRLLLGIGALLPAVRFETDHPASLGRRPNADLLAALRQLGLDVTAREPEGLLPITLRGGPPRGGAVTVSGARSSQYLSALLYLAPLLPRGLEITVTDDLRSAPLVRATLGALAAAGIEVSAALDLRHFVVPGGQRFAARDYTVPGDIPSAAALSAAALALGRPVTFTGFGTETSDTRDLLAALTALGAHISLPSATSRTIEPSASSASSASSAPSAVPLSRSLPSVPPISSVVSPSATVILDADAITDSVPVLAAAACFVPGETRFERAGTLRLKESDRIGDLRAELARAGADDITAEDDAIVVRGRPEGIAGGVSVAGHDDHRLVQALAVAALRSAGGLTITDADAVAKSYPGFFADLARLGARVTVLEP